MQENKNSKGSSLCEEHHLTRDSPTFYTTHRGMYDPHVFGCLFGLFKNALARELELIGCGIVRFQNGVG